MSFNVGLSGLRGSQTDLNTIGNNVANASTTGFKKSRAEFGDMYAASMFGTSKNTTGSGVSVLSVSQQHTQGDPTDTGRPLDLSIAGNGYFVVSDNGETKYTRNGVFGTDNEGYVVSNAGGRLQGYGLDNDGNIIPGVLSDLRIDRASIPPRATTEASVQYELPTGTDVITTPFDPTDATTYTNVGAFEVFDSLGASHTVRQYFVKAGEDDGGDPYSAGSTGPQTKWHVYTSVDGSFIGPDPDPADPDVSGPVYELDDATGQYKDGAGNVLGEVPAAGDPPVGLSASMVFNNRGQLLDAQATDITGAAAVSANPTRFELSLGGLVPGADFGSGNPGNDIIDMGVNGSTQYSEGDNFSFNRPIQDGYATGLMSGLEVDSDGVIYATYTNRKTRAIGQVPLATFTNEQGLKPIGGTAWTETADSGQPAVNVAGSGVTGEIEGGKLESSNVELSEELVKMIVAQRNYQANAKTIQTEDTLTQTIINMR